MTFKTIAAFIDASPDGQARADYAARLALRFAAHLVGVYALPVTLGTELPEAFARGPDAMQEVIGRREGIERELATAVGQLFAAITQRHAIGGEFRVVRQDLLEDETVLSSLHSDLVVVGHPEPNGLPDNRSPEGLLLATGVPILVLPEGHPPEAGGRVLVAWNASRQARRAITDALPFLRTATSVVLLVVDPQDNSRHGEEAGADIALWLARHGVQVEVERRESLGRSVAAVIRGYAEEQAMDLIVLGAYSHARSAERVFGGVTRSLLKASPVPLLIAH